MAPMFPVSVKAVVISEGGVILLKNERDEWELPGGRLERGETPEQTVVRELDEELGADIQVEALIDCWVYQVGGKEVLILSYSASLENDPDTLAISSEHQDWGRFGFDELKRLNLPDGYRRSIWRARYSQVKGAIS